MKEILYEFYDGHVECLEVEDAVAEVYGQIVAEEERNERKETRRHQSLEVMLDAGFDFEDDRANIDYILEQQELCESERRFRQEYNQCVRAMYKVLKKYIPKRQAQAYLLYTQMYFSKVEIAKLMGITEGAVRKLLLKAKDNIKKLKDNLQEIRKMPYVSQTASLHTNVNKQ